MSTEIFQPNHKLNIAISNRDGASLKCQTIMNTLHNEEVNI